MVFELFWHAQTRRLNVFKKRKPIILLAYTQANE